MEKKIKVLILLFLAIAIAVVFNIAGCSKPKAPTKAEFAKAIVEHALAADCKIMPQTILTLEPGKRKEDGSWTYRLRYSCLETPAEPAKRGQRGLVRPVRTEREETVDIYKKTDDAGKAVWVVR